MCKTGHDSFCLVSRLINDGSMQQVTVCLSFDQLCCVLHFALRMLGSLHAHQSWLHPKMCSQSTSQYLIRWFIYSRHRNGIHLGQGLHCKNYTAHRSPNPGFLFQFSDGKPLSSDSLSSELKQHFKQLQLTPL